jgi:uncharacterized Fe-S cluster protein YjdI
MLKGHYFYNFCKHQRIKELRSMIGYVNREIKLHENNCVESSTHVVNIGNQDIKKPEHCSG